MRQTRPRMHALPNFLRGAVTTPPGPLARRIGAVDARVESSVAELRSPAADRLFYSLSSAADHGLLWMAIGAVRAAVRPHHRRSLVRLAIGLGIESGLTNGVIKSFFRRVRPLDQAPPRPLPYGMHRPITSAFPSGHAASAFTAATLLAEDDPLAPAYYALATLVAASRVYVKLHHASDVIAGTAWGLAFGRVIRQKYPLRPTPEGRGAEARGPGSSGPGS